MISDIEQSLSKFNNGTSLLSLGDGSKASVSSLDLKAQDSHSFLSNPTIVDQLALFLLAFNLIIPIYFKFRVITD